MIVRAAFLCATLYQSEFSLHCDKYMALIVGVVIGLVLGLTGAGGSVFAVPLLIVLLGLPAQQAIGLSLGAVAISALFGSLSRLKGGDIQWLPAMVYAVVGGLVAPLGNWSNRQIDESVLMIAFSVLVLVIASRMWIQANRHPQDAMIVRAGQQESIEQAGAICRFNHFETFQIGLPCVLGITVGASVTGLLSRLFGVGGGFLIVPTLLFLTGITIRQAVVTSLVIIAIVSGSGFVSYLLTGEHLNTSLLLLIASGGVVGMVLGIVISRYIAGPGLQKLFSVLMLVMAILTLVMQLAN